MTAFFCVLMLFDSIPNTLLPSPSASSVTSHGSIADRPGVQDVSLEIFSESMPKTEEGYVLLTGCYVLATDVDASQVTFYHWVSVAYQDYFEHYWKDKILYLFNYLAHLDTVGIHANDYKGYGEFCLSPLGVLKQHELQYRSLHTIYFLLIVVDYWVEKLDNSSSERGEKIASEQLVSAPLILIEVVFVDDFSRIGRSGFCNVSGLIPQEFINLSFTGDTDGGLQNLSRLLSLKSLLFVVWQMTDTALVALTGPCRQPTWGHLKDMHNAIKLSEAAIDPTITSLGTNLEAAVYKKGSSCAIFLANIDAD